MAGDKQQNFENTPEHIIKACERVLYWVENKKDRKAIQEYIARTENR